VIERVNRRFSASNFNSYMRPWLTDLL